VALGPINGTSEADALRLPTLQRHRGARLPRPRRAQRRRSAEVDMATGGTSRAANGCLPLQTSEAGQEGPAPKRSGDEKGPHHTKPSQPLLPASPSSKGGDGDTYRRDYGRARRGQNRHSIAVQRVPVRAASDRDGTLEDERKTVEGTDGKA